tara:strand:+ start:182 stop:1057 length:876 start_codon:yes stop_codon:yes gene_type:complete
MSQLLVDTIVNKDDTGAPQCSKGLVVTGTTTSTDGYYSGNVTIGGTLTYEDVTNIDSVGIVTARGGFLAGNPAVSIGATITGAGAASFSGIGTFSGNLNVGTGITAYASTSNLNVGTGVTVYGSTGIVSATAFYGDGAALSGVVSGIEVESGGTSVGTSLTAINFASGATVTQGSSGITTVTIAAGITTYANVASGIVSTLYLSDAQDHKVTTTGFVTFTCSGGAEGESHTLRIVNSGISTVGFGTYFLWPGGASPVLPTASGAISLISFTVQRVGAGGTQLLAGASLNFS